MCIRDSVRVEKNKVTKNDRRLDSYTLNYFRGVDDGTDTIDLGIKLGVIEQSNSCLLYTSRCV